MFYAILSDSDEPLVPSVRVCVHDNPKETALEKTFSTLLKLFVFCDRFALSNQLLSQPLRIHTLRISWLWFWLKVLFSECIFIYMYNLSVLLINQILIFPKGLF